MKRLLLGVAAAALIAAFSPANAQVYLGAGPDGAGVQVGPLGVGVGPDYWGYHHRWRDDYAYAPDCRIVRERFVTPRGHVIWRSHRECY
jgi:hypothetical protein